MVLECEFLKHVEAVSCNDLMQQAQLPCDAPSVLDDEVRRARARGILMDQDGSHWTLRYSIAQDSNLWFVATVAFLYCRKVVG